MNYLLRLLETKTTPFEIICAGVIAVALIFLPGTIKTPEKSWYEPMELLTKKERLYFLAPRDRIRWCEIRRDCKVLAEAVAYEARSEDEVGKAAVAFVILNRKDDTRWGHTIPDVVYQHKQFSYTNKGQEQRTKPSEFDLNNAKELCFYILNGMMESPVGSATFYHTKKVNPKWAKHLDYVATIGHHIFYE